MATVSRHFFCVAQTIQGFAKFLVDKAKARLLCLEAAQYAWVSGT